MSAGESFDLGGNRGDWRGPGTHNVDTRRNESIGGSSCGTWDRAAGKAVEPNQKENPSEKEKWFLKGDKQKEVTAPDESEEELKPQQADKQGDGNKPGQTMQQSADNQFRPTPGRLACAVCGLRNHTTEECRQNLLYELCGFANHTTLHCKREPLWNVGPELCAAQVNNQSFFYIDENIDPKASREKARIAIITVSRGELTTKQLENDFKNVVSSEHWKWSARKIADNKFTMRFANAK